MRTHRFYNKPCSITGDSNWFIDLPKFPFDKEWLAMVAGADTLLDQLCEGKKEINLKISTAPIPYSDGVLIKKEKNLKGFLEGRMYEAQTGYTESDNSKVDNVWLCAVTLWVFWKYPKKIHYKIVK